MSKRLVLADDITGKEIPEGGGGTIQFSLRGEFFEIDLADESLAKLEKALATYIEHAVSVEAPSEPVRKGRGPLKLTKLPGKGPDYLAAVRTWARANGYELSDRGRIKAEIQEAYEAAH